MKNFMNALVFTLAAGLMPHSGAWAVDTFANAGLVPTAPIISAQELRQAWKEYHAAEAAEDKKISAEQNTCDKASASKVGAATQPKPVAQANDGSLSKLSNEELTQKIAAGDMVAMQELRNRTTQTAFPGMGSGQSSQADKIYEQQRAKSEKQTANALQNSMHASIMGREADPAFALCASKIRRREIKFPLTAFFEAAEAPKLLGQKNTLMQLPGGEYVRNPNPIEVVHISTNGGDLNIVEGIPGGVFAYKAPDGVHSFPILTIEEALQMIKSPGTYAVRIHTASPQTPRL